MNACYVARAECGTLADWLAVGCDDGWPIRIYRERVCWVVHDRTVIVVASIVTVGNMLKEIVLGSALNVAKVDCDKSIAIFAALLMPQPYCMSNLMDGVSCRTIRAEGYKLLSALTPHR